MNNHEKATSLVKQGLAALKCEIDSYANRVVTGTNVSQLIAFQTTLEEIMRQLESEKIPEKDLRMFGIAHTIADSWPSDSKLGDLLCSAERAYRKL